MSKIVSPNEDFFAVNPRIRQAVEEKGITISDIDFLDVKFRTIVRGVVNQMYEYFPTTVHSLSVTLKDGRVVEIDPSTLTR